ncbi:MAG: aquaporin Z [Acidobacteriales bacterium]|nr:aquaporin Z [Terriglobales bacterium]
MKKYFAELVGTFVLVFGGVGSAVLAGDKIGYLGVSFAFGLSLLAMVYTIGPISGCHINPAVTLGALVSKRISGRDALVYMAAQVVGAIIAGAVILVIAQGAATGYDATQAGLGANGYATHSPGQFSLAAAFVAEVILTMFLVLTVLGATDTRAPAGFAGIAIGLVLTLIHLVGIPVTNTSVNPARSIGVAVFVGGWAIQQLWLFIFAPLTGALLSAGVHNAIRLPAEVITTHEAEEALPSERVQRETHRPAA